MSVPSFWLAIMFILLFAALGYISTAPWLSYWPGLAIFVSVLGFNLFGDGLRDALDPRLR